MADLQLICDACKEPVTGDSGSLWIDNDALTKVVRDVTEWNRKHTRTDGIFSGHLVVEGAELFTYPDPVRWRAHHSACDPEPDANAYSIAANRIDTWAELLDWTAHLMEKDWLTHTDWDDLLRGVHGGRHRLVIAPSSKEPS